MAGAAAVVACSDDDQVAAPSSGPDAQADSTNQGTDTGISCPAPTTPTCTNAGCTTKNGAPSVCVNDQCVVLTTADCPLAYPATIDDNSIIIGASHANRGPNKAPGDEINQVMQFSIDEINGQGGIRSKDPCSPAKKLAMIACDETDFLADGGTYVAPLPDAGIDAGPSPRQQSWNHLANELKVPVIFGGVTSPDGIALGQWVIPKYKTMVIASRSASPALVNVTGTPNDGFEPDGYRLMWRASQNLNIEIAAGVQVYSQVEQQVKAARNLPSVKVAFIFKNDSFGQPFASGFRGTTTPITVNGTVYTGSASDAGTRTDILEETFQFVDGTGIGLAKQQVRNDVIAYNPDIIFIVASDEGVTEFIQPLETAFASKPANQRPYWIGARGLRSLSMTTYIDAIADSTQKADFLTRLRGLVPGSITSLTQDFFNLRFKTQYPNAQLIDGVREVYDMMYFTSYVATNALGKGALDSKALVDNVDSVLTGTTAIDVGPTDFVAQSKSLATGGNINLNGTFSGMDYNKTTGETPVDTYLWCMNLDPNTQKSVFNLTTGQHYDAAQKTLVGTFKCQ